MTFARVRAILVVAVLFVIAVVVGIMAIGRDTQTGSARSRSCPPGLVPADITMHERNEVTLNIFNGTAKSGLAQQVGTEFKSRGFNVHQTETIADGKVYDEIAVITYGPETVGDAWLVSAYFLVDEARMNFDIARMGGEVDVIIGTQFQQLATMTEVNQSIAALGNPEPEPGTCAA